MADLLVSEPTAPVTLAPAGRRADRVFRALAMAAASVVVVLLVLLVFQLVRGAIPVLREKGPGVFASTEWNPGGGEFGALPFIYGTLVTSVIALVIAVPLSIFTAIYLTDLAPLLIRQPVVTVIELLAAVPSVIWGLWGIFVMVPWLREFVFPALRGAFGHLPGIGALFSGPIFGLGYLSAGIVVSIMIIPIITAVAREILRSVPDLQREAAYALGATRWEVTRIAVLSFARRGLVGAVILGLGRALGETMAVTMVIGNSPTLSTSLFAPGYSLAAVIANEFGEAGADPLYGGALFTLALVLLAITVAVNIVARLMVQATGGGGTARVV